MSSVDWLLHQLVKVACGFIGNVCADYQSETYYRSFSLNRDLKQRKTTHEQLRRHFGPKKAWKILWSNLQPMLTCNWRNCMGVCCPGWGSRLRLFLVSLWGLWRGALQLLAGEGQLLCFGDFVEYLGFTQIWVLYMWLFLRNLVDDSPWFFFPKSCLYFPIFRLLRILMGVPQPPLCFYPIPDPMQNALLGFVCTCPKTTFGKLCGNMRSVLG